MTKPTPQAAVRPARGRLNRDKVAAIRSTRGFTAERHETDGIRAEHAVHLAVDSVMNFSVGANDALTVRRRVTMAANLS
jgi:ribosomal protein L13E